MSRWLVFGSLISAGIVGSFPVGSYSRLESRDCYPATAPISRTILGGVRRAISEPRFEQLRKTLGLSRLPADSAVLVVDTELCNRASKAVAQHEHIDEANVQLVVIRLGAVLWAEDPKLVVGEWRKLFLLDGSGSRVLARR